MKFSIVYLIFVTILATVYCNRQTVIWCDPKPGDRLMHVGHYEIKGSPFKVKTKTITVPENGPSAEVIHCVRAIDNLELTNKGDAIFTIEDGGIGSHYIVMKITSHKGKGYNFDIEVYGGLEQ